MEKPIFAYLVMQFVTIF